MGISIVLLVCELLIPLLMLMAGYCMDRHPPKRIRRHTGYRSRMSMKNMDTWMYAQQYCGKLWCKLGVILLIPSVLVAIPFLRAESQTAGMVALVIVLVQTCVMLASLFFVERELKSVFDADGKRK